jgi:putative addiction module component (TIGR02574 family)
MPSDPAFDYRQLSVAERLELVEEIWDSIAADADADTLPLSESERQLLDERLADLEANPDAGSPWPQVRARILGKPR